MLFVSYLPAQLLYYSYGGQQIEEHTEIAKFFFATHLAIALLSGFAIAIAEKRVQRYYLPVGFAAMARALDKTHAAALQREPRPWFHALLTHPALAVRALQLALAAPSDERARIVVDLPLVRRCLRVRRLALTLWLGLLAVIATPLSRVVAAAVAFARAGDGRMVGVAVAILAVIAVSIVTALAVG